MVLRAVKQRKVIEEDWVYMQDIHICFHHDGIVSLDLEYGEEDRGIRHIHVSLVE